MLSDIIDDVKQVTQAINLALDCDVETIDSKLTRIAATGTVSMNQGQKLRHGHVYSYVLQNKEPVFLATPGQHFLCKNCAISGQCYYKVTIAAPIVFKGEAVGIIAIMALEEDKVAYIINHQSQLVCFLQEMAKLLSTKISEYKLLISMEFTTAALTSMLNKSKEGLIAVDGQGNVLHYNEKILKLLNIDVDNAPKELKDIFSKFYPYQTKLKKRMTWGKKDLLIEIEPLPCQDNINNKDKSNKFWLISCHDYDLLKKSASALTVADNFIKFTDILTQDIQMQNLIEMLKKVAKSSSTVLILGESGTGKEMFARAIHSGSGRGGMMISINCGAIPETLLESELFGYEAGAFTGANKEGKPGKFELADGGTLFLDEIGTMPFHLQTKLLRVLEDFRVERLGSTSSKTIDVRIIAATNEDLELRVKEGRFRQDLYFRLNVIPCHIPPLRQRKDDISLLAEFFLKRYCQKLKKNIEEIEPAALEILCAYHWPGNIRELSNSIEFAVNMEESFVLTPDSLKHQFKNWPGLAKDLFPKEDFRENLEDNSNSLDEIRTQKLRSLLEQYGQGKKGKQKAAEILGVSLATIYRWVEKYHLSSQ